MRNTIIEGDCLEVMPSMPDGSVDMVLADLPYAATDNAWDSAISLNALWAQYKRLLKPTGALVFTASQPFTSILVMSNPAWFRCEWIWEKSTGSNFATTKWLPMKEHESVLVFAKETPTYNAQPQARSDAGQRRHNGRYTVAHKAKTANYGGFARDRDDDSRVLRTPMRIPSSIQYFTREVGLHPTQKPVSLFRYFIRTYSNPGDLVLDNAAGSCTTAIACHHEGRDFICIEKEAKYVEIGRKRLADEQAQLRLFTA